MSFNLDLLLRSKNFHVDTDHIRSIGLECDNEIVLWQDSSGPLRVCRVEAGGFGFYRLRLGDDIAVDVLSDRRLLILAHPSVPKISIDHFLADQVFPRLASQEGEFVLHAGAVRAHGTAILLLGASGRGKSTLATSLHCQGWPLMGDDAVVIQLAPGSPVAKAIYPSLRLFPDSIEALLDDPVECEDIAHYTSKQRLAVPIVEETAPAPVKTIFVLDEPSGGEISVKRLSLADACMAIVENSFALDPTDIGRARSRLTDSSDLANKVPVFAISYPRDYALLPLVCERILAEAGVDAALQC